MQYALIDNLRRTAEPKLKAICEHCGNPVQAKCGSKVVWHWAHVSTENCDPWYEPETQWHKDWKNKFGIKQSEISIIKEGKKHIADVLTKDQLVIEFQNSPISSETITERELFYEKMIWIINGNSFKDSFRIWNKEYQMNWQLKPEIIPDFYNWNLKKRRRSLIVRGIQIKQKEIRTILINQKFIHTAFEDIYCYDLSEGESAFAVEARVQAGILKLYRERSSGQHKKRINYEWQRPRKSWRDAQAPVFIDFGEDHLIWIKSNMGYKEGEGLKIYKKEFLEKYAGDNNISL